MSYEFADTLYPTRGAAIRGLILAWCDLPHLAELGETPDEIVAGMRDDAWLDDFEARYGALDDSDVAGYVEELVGDHREEQFRAACSDLWIYGLDNEGGAFECSGLALLLDNEGVDEIRDALRRLLDGELVARLPGKLGVTLTALTDEQVEAAARDGWHVPAEGHTAGRVRLAISMGAHGGNDLLLGFAGSVTPMSAAELLAVKRAPGLQAEAEAAVKALMDGDAIVVALGACRVARVTDGQLRAMRDGSDVEGDKVLASMALSGSLLSRHAAAEYLQRERDAAARDACRVLAAAYAAGADGGSVAWEDLDRAHELALAALGRGQ